MKRRCLTLLFTIVLGLPFFAMGMAPAEVANIRAQAEGLIGQMEPNARNFDDLKTQVTSKIEKLRTGGQVAVALEIQSDLNDKVGAKLAMEDEASAQQVEKLTGQLKKAGADEQKLQDLLDAQKKQIEELQSLEKHLSESNKEIQKEAINYSKMVEKARKAAKEGPDQVISVLEDFVGKK